MAEIPEEFPGAWQNLTIDVRRMLTQRLLDKSLELHGGSEGLIKFLYVGQAYETISRAEGYGARGRDFWPYVAQDTKLFIAKREAKQANPSGEAR